MDNVLYFPTIAFPQTAWANRILLYWDKIGAIVPARYLEDDNEEFDPYTQELMTTGLLQQVSPEYYLGGIPEFGQIFLDHIQSLGEAERRRRKQTLDLYLEHAKVIKGIYFSKLGDIDEELEKMEVAYRQDRWLVTDDLTFYEFMTYLAVTLGLLDDAGYMPVTDRISNLDVLQRFVQQRREKPAKPDALITHDNAVLTELLESAFPIPDQALEPGRLMQFKQNNHEELRRLRLFIEKKIIEITYAGSEAERNARLNHAKEEIKFEREIIVERLERSGLAAKYGGIGWVSLKKVPKAGVIFEFLEALKSKGKTANLDHPLAYAALAELAFEKKVGR